MGKETFNEVLESIENDDMREFAKVLLDTIPSYFYKAPASSSGRYHPSYCLGEGGLVRHTLAVVKILNYIFEVEYYKNQFTSRERDIMRIAALMHDSRKSGSQEDYEKNPQTKFEHPLLAAEIIDTFNNSEYLNYEELQKIKSCIISHMGSWCTSNYSDIVLPKPLTKIQGLVHLADYLASRKNIEINLNK